MPYKRLTREQRHTIQLDLDEGKSASEIARRLQVHRSTISREIQRNRNNNGVYSYSVAEKMARDRSNKSWSKSFDWVEIELRLRKDHSPDQVRGNLRSAGLSSPSNQTIYNYILLDKIKGGDLYKHLRRHKKPYRKLKGTGDKRGQIKHKVSIDDRPKEVDDKLEMGHWEADTVIGRIGGKVLVTLTERHTRYTLMALAPNKEAAEVSAVITELLKEHKVKVKTITYDNGKEFALHYVVNKVLECDSYFCHPYHSWERGLNENTNGLIRQYLEKGSSFDDVSDCRILEIQNHLNSRPRKCLDYSLPDDMFLVS